MVTFQIFCAKCKLNEAFPDNDIVLCDGTCNAAFHQKCLDPPLDTENSEFFISSEFFSDLSVTNQLPFLR